MHQGAVWRDRSCGGRLARASVASLWGGTEGLLPAEAEAARLALEAPLGVLGKLVHQCALLLHDVPVGRGADGRLVAAGLAREAAVGVAHGRLVVALERVEVGVRARGLRVPGVEDGRLGVEAPDAIEVVKVEAA